MRSRCALATGEDDDIDGSKLRELDEPSRFATEIATVGATKSQRALTPQSARHGHRKQGHWAITIGYSRKYEYVRGIGVTALYEFLLKSATRALTRPAL